MADFIIELNRWQFALTLGVFVIVAGLEQLIPQRNERTLRWTRWSANFLLFAAGFGLVVLISPALLNAAGWVQRSIGFPTLISLGLPAWVLVIVSFLIIDLIGYLSHVLSHQLPWLWRLHRTHHSDVVVDASTSIRHHPLESLVGGAIQITAYAILGLPLLVIIAYGLTAAVFQFLHHLDVRAPEPLDRVLRIVFVTPGMHRLHHSVRMDEGNSNFGVLLSIWDRLFGTYRRRTYEDRLRMPVGVDGFPVGPGVLGPLIEPFRRQQ